MKTYTAAERAALIEYLNASKENRCVIYGVAEWQKLDAMRDEIALASLMAEPVAWVKHNQLNWLSSHEYIQADLFSQQEKLDDIPLFTYVTPDGLPEMLSQLALWINTLPVPTDSATKWLIRVSNMRDKVLRRKGIAAPEA